MNNQWISTKQPYSCNIDPDKDRRALPAPPMPLPGLLPALIQCSRVTTSRLYHRKPDRCFCMSRG